MIKRIKKVYDNPTELSKEIFDEIKVGDSISQGKKPMKVVGISENYIFAVQNNFGELYYSIFSKHPATHSRNEYNYPHCLKLNYYYCGPMNLIGGGSYEDYNTQEGVKENLRVLESGEFEISERRTYTYDKLTVWIKEGK